MSKQVVKRDIVILSNNFLWSRYFFDKKMKVFLNPFYELGKPAESSQYMQAEMAYMYFKFVLFKMYEEESPS